jgi:hypothetical protein
MRKNADLRLPHPLDKHDRQSRGVSRTAIRRVSSENTAAGKGSLAKFDDACRLRSPPSSPSPLRSGNVRDKLRRSVLMLARSDWVSLEGLVSSALVALGKSECTGISELGRCYLQFRLFFFFFLPAFVLDSMRLFSRT